MYNFINIRFYKNQRCEYVYNIYDLRYEAKIKFHNIQKEIQTPFFLYIKIIMIYLNK